MKRLLGFPCLLLLSSGLIAGGAQPVVVARGPEFLLIPGDTSTGARAAMDEEGHFLALFWNQFAGFVEARGGTLDELRPPFFFGGGARGAGLAALGSGEFAISWSQLQGYEGIIEDVLLRRYATDGTPLGPEVAVSDAPSEMLGARTAIAAQPGTFLVVWEQAGEGAYALRGRVIPEGEAPTASFPLNTWTTGSHSRPRLAAAEDGRALAVWGASDCGAGDPSGGCVRGRYLDSTGTPQGSDFVVNSETSGTQILADVAATESGFVAVWRSADCGSQCIRGRLLDQDGDPVGTDFRVDEAGAEFVNAPGVSAQPTGHFIVTWTRRTAGSDALTFGRAFNAAALPLTGEFQVNSDPASEPYGTDVAINGAGNFVVAWNDGYNLWGRLFDFNSLVFQDGFESGDTTAWSQVVP